MKVMSCAAIASNLRRSPCPRRRLAPAQSEQSEDTLGKTRRVTITTGDYYSGGTRMPRDTGDDRHG
jgi:hypothetical protein